MHALMNRIRLLPIAAVVAGMLLAATAADAAPGKKKGKTVTAKIALGDKRVKHANMKASASSAKPKGKGKSKSKPKTKAKKSAVATCANTDVMPTPETIEVVRDAILCLHNQIRSQKGLPLLRDNAKLRKAANGHSTAMVSDG